jgi:cell division protein ZapA (FtsZ GTPase activity inhibitor)
MNRQTKKYTVTIGGQIYALVSDEPEELVHNAARLVNSLLAQLQAKASDLDEQRLAILIAVKIALDFVRSQSERQRDLTKLGVLVEKLDGWITALQ